MVTYCHFFSSRAGAMCELAVECEENAVIEYERNMVSIFLCLGTGINQTKCFSFSSSSASSHFILCQVLDFHSLDPAFHLYSRMSPYPSAPGVGRCYVPDDLVDWNASFPEYHPPVFTANSVTDKPTPPWADSVSDRTFLLYHFTCMQDLLF